MKKFSFYLMLISIITSCDSKEDVTTKSQALNNPMQLYIINGDIKYYSEITDGSKPKKPILVYDIPAKTEELNNLTSKTSEQSVTINFNYGIGGSTKSGCTITRYMQSGQTYETDAGVYGSIPYNYNGYLIRGYGTPSHNFDYNSLILQSSNKGVKAIIPRSGTIINDNSSSISALSIEYPFKANVTYEISLKTFFKDNRKWIQNVQSSGFPTLSVALESSGILFNGTTSCENDFIYSATAENYIKFYTLEDNILKDRIITYKFSPTEDRKALIFKLIPGMGTRGVDAKIPTNSYTMALKTVTITEKPFDPSINIISPRPPGR